MHAKTLIEHAKKYALDLGLPLHMGVLVSDNDAESDREKYKWAPNGTGRLSLYARQLEPAGTMFVFNRAPDRLPVPAPA